MLNGICDKALSGILPGEPAQRVERRVMSDSVTPFQEEASIENYFAGKPSEELWQQLRHVFTEESTLMIVTGEAGVGKTMFCKKIAKESELPASVFFFEMMESFGDVIAEIADAFFGITLEQELTGDAQINGLCDALKQRGVPVLLVFDQAENLYLATLERIRRLYDSLCKAGVSTYVLFIGRPEFLDSYKQLVICNFAEARERFFSLAELSANETERYLWHVAERSRESERVLFSRPEFIQSLYQMSSGNYRTINTVVKEWLSQPQEPEAFIEVLQNTGEKEQREQENGLFTRLRGVLYCRFLMLRQFCTGLYGRFWREQPPRQRKILLALFGLLVVSGIAFLLPSGDKSVADKEQTVSPAEPASKPVIKQNEKKQEIQPSAMAPTGQVVVAPIVVSGEKSTFINKPVEAKSEAAGKEPVSPVLTFTTGQKKVLIQQEDNLPPVEESVPIVIQAISRKHGMPAMEEEGEEEVGVALQAEVESLPVITPARRKVRFQQVIDSGEDSSVSSAQSVSQQEEKIVLLRPLKSSKYKVSAKGKSLASGRVTRGVTERERLVQNRFVAGMGWRNANKGSLYTIKVAQLAGSETKRLDEIFTARRFRPLVTDLYLFSKGLSPEYVIIFYGEYSRKEDAEKALRDISDKFPEYRPSLMTIKEAMQSVRR